MISRYLGNKQSILSPLLEAIGELAPAGSHVVDAFSGSLSVSMGLKAAGYSVTANDVNLFSSVLGEAYLVPTTLPPLRITTLVPVSFRRELEGSRAAVVDAVLNDPRYSLIRDSIDSESLESLILVIEYLNTCDDRDLPKPFRRSDFYDSYCEAGALSGFVSLRGRSGNRRFFTPENAARIDVILNHLRFWAQHGALDKAAVSLLLAIIMRAVERIANTQGTYHDFPRSGWDSRALNSLTLEVPDLRLIYSGSKSYRVGREEDTLDFIQSVKHHSVLYLDPPYNFRQYSAYYFLLNVVCRYVDLVDPEDYFANLRYVRGQNPMDDFTSSFCKASSFIGDMRTLIQRADCDAVVISYFNGRNHWSKFDSGPNTKGQELLENLLCEDVFEAGSQQTRRVSRKNYASYGGYLARDVDELILSARLVQNEDRESRGSVRDAIPELV